MKICIAGHLRGNARVGVPGSIGYVGELRRGAGIGVHDIVRIVIAHDADRIDNSIEIKPEVRASDLQSVTDGSRNARTCIDCVQRQIVGKTVQQTIAIAKIESKECRACAGNAGARRKCSGGSAVESHEVVVFVDCDKCRSVSTGRHEGASE